MLLESGYGRGAASSASETSENSAMGPNCHDRGLRSSFRSPLAGADLFLIDEASIVQDGSETTEPVDEPEDNQCHNLHVHSFG